MKKVEYVCDVCGGKLINRYTLDWISMVFGWGIFKHCAYGRNNRLDVCNNCWIQCREWARKHTWDK